MEAATELSPTEQKYFDTRGAELPPAEEEVTEQASPEEGVAKAADVPADDATTPEDDKTGEDNPGKFVRHGAFHEERMRRKEVEQQLVSFREQQAAEKARLEERLNTLAQRLQQPEPVITDPNERLARLEQTITQQRQQEEQARKQQENLNNFYNLIQTKEAEFSRDVPDYEDAVAFAKQERVKDIAALGYSDAEVQQMIERDILSFSDDAFRRGKNPAELFYNYAKARGWGKEQAPAPKEQAPADKLKTIAAGQQAGKSLGAAPGSSQAQLTLQSLADMPQEDFDKIDAKTWRKMMGG